MKRSSRHSESSLKIALIFSCCIFLLIAGGLFLKLFLVLQASTFDGVHQYIVEVDESHTKGLLVAFNPSEKSVVLLHVNGKIDSTFGNYLGIPVDGSVTMQIPSSPTKLATDMIFRGGNEKYMTIIDRLRILFFVNSLKRDQFHENTISLPIDNTISEKLLPQLFLDSSLYFDNESISVINATGEEGVATDVAHRLSVIGMNIVSVTTAQNQEDKSTLFAVNTSSYTTRRIEHLFNLNAKETASGGISDITLTIGKKSLSELE